MMARRRSYSPPSLDGWGPLSDRGRRSRSRGLGLPGVWFLAGAGLLLAVYAALLAYLIVTDPAPGLGGRSLAVVILATVAGATLIVRGNRQGGLAGFRTVAEYGVVALLVLLLIPVSSPPPATVDDGRDQPVALEQQDQDQAQPKRAGQLPPVIRQVVGTWRWLADRWREAGDAVDRQTRKETDQQQRERTRAAPPPTTNPGGNRR